jgi:hypothetical protein
MRNVLILLLMFTLASCGKAPKQNFFTGLDLDTDVLTQLKTIGHAVNSSAQHNVLSFSGGTRPIKIVMVSPDKMNDGIGLSPMRGLEWHHATTLAQTRYLEYNCYVEVRNDIRQQMAYYHANGSAELDRAIQLVILHEIGHCFGLGHTPEEDLDSLMNPLYQPNWANNGLYQDIINTFSLQLKGLSD